MTTPDRLAEKPLFNLVGTNTWCVRFTADRRIEINPEYTAEGAAADFVRIVHEMAGKSAPPTPVPGVSDAMVERAMKGWNDSHPEVHGNTRKALRAALEAAVQSPPAGGGGQGAGPKSVACPA